MHSARCQRFVGSLYVHRFAWGLINGERDIAISRLQTAGTESHGVKAVCPGNRSVQDHSKLFGPFHNSSLSYPKNYSAFDDRRRLHFTTLPECCLTADDRDRRARPTGLRRFSKPSDEILRPTFHRPNPNSISFGLPNNFSRGNFFVLTFGRFKAKCA